MPAPRKTTRRRPPGHPPADYQQPDNPASQPPARRRRRTSIGTTDSYKIRAPAPKITLATLHSTERQCPGHGAPTRYIVATTGNLPPNVPDSRGHN
jgi:hypothetical protein